MKKCNSLSMLTMSIFCLSTLLDNLNSSCTQAADPAKKLVLIKTNHGDIKVELFEKEAPISVRNFLEYAESGFYEGTVFHRVIDGFMAQTGDPTGTGMGGSKLPDIKAEFSDEPHTRGAVSMARASDPNSANSQFFIVTHDSR